LSWHNPCKSTVDLKATAVRGLKNHNRNSGGKTMAINFEKAFGVHEAALNIRSQRAEVLANNLANADTPNFKARDIDFSKALLQAQSNSATGLKRTSTQHMDSRIGTEVPGLS